jgi:alcohol dehydrogenase YqhD (iron-dependent ADH family)
MMGSTLANSTLLGVGCDSDWAMHYMENPITTETHSPHGSTLAIVAPAWMRYCYERDLPKAVHFAVRVMGVAPQADDKATALAGIDAFAAFLKEVGLPTSLREIGVEPDQFAEFARRASATAGQERIGGISKLSQDEVVEIYKLAY